MKYINNLADKIANGIAIILPKNIVYWVLIRVWVYSTLHQWASQETGSIQIDQAIKLWSGKEAMLPLTILSAIHKLRSEEGDSVMIFCDNPEFTGPNNAVECCGAWTDWVDRRFTGRSLFQALSAAVSARTAVT